MEHNVSLITTLAAGFGAALILGALAERIRVPALVGYLVAGMLIGPATPGFVADMAIAAQLSEIGVMLLMFGVGLHFSLGDLLSVKRLAIPGAVVQMTIATVLGAALAIWWGWSWGAGLIFGLSLSCASTVVLLKALESRDLLETMNGRIAVGWLVVEDLACVLVLVLMPPLAGLLSGAGADGGAGIGAGAGSGGGAGDQAGAEIAPLWQTISLTLLQVAAFIGLMLVVGRRLLPRLLWEVSRTGSRELFTLAIVTAAIGIAVGAAKLFSVSFALGAFFAGMVMRESEFSHRAAQESLPLRDAFSVLFFVSVGMLFDPAVVVDQPAQLIAVVAIVVFGKTFAALGLVLAYRYPLNTALTVAASLAQIGEFSFILAGLGLALGVLPAKGMSLVLAGSLISIAINPLVFALIEPARRWILERSSLARWLEQRDDPYAELPHDTERKYLQGQVVLVGFGRVGRRIAAGLDAGGVPYVVAEQNRELVEDLRRQGHAAVAGNAADPVVLVQAHVSNAAMLVIATSRPLDVRAMAETARLLNPAIEIVVRTHSETESQLLRSEGIGTVFFGEEELARGMTTHVVQRFAPRARSTAPSHA